MNSIGSEVQWFKYMKKVLLTKVVEVVDFSLSWEDAGLLLDFFDPSLSMLFILILFLYYRNYPEISINMKAAILVAIIVFVTIPSPAPARHVLVFGPKALVTGVVGSKEVMMPEGI